MMHFCGTRFLKPSEITTEVEVSSFVCDLPVTILGAVDADVGSIEAWRGACCPAAGKLCIAGAPGGPVRGGIAGVVWGKVNPPNPTPPTAAPGKLAAGVADVGPPRRPLNKS